MELTIYFILTLFVLGYIAIVMEHFIHINKTAVALFVAVVLWAVYILSSTAHLQEDLARFGEHVSDISQILFFLMGAMTLVELVDAHKGFKIITDLI